MSQNDGKLTCCKDPFYFVFPLFDKDITKFNKSQLDVFL